MRRIEKRHCSAEKHCTAPQLALAWVLARGQDIVPIPGTKRRKYLEENAGALNVRLTAADLARIDAVVPEGSSRGLAIPRRNDAPGPGADAVASVKRPP